MGNEFECPSCQKTVMDEQKSFCLHCNATVCRECNKEHMKLYPGKMPNVFTVKCIISVFIFIWILTGDWTIKINGSEKLSIYKLIMIYGFVTIPFGWHVIEKVEGGIWNLITFGLFNKRRRKIDYNHLTEEDIKTIKNNIIINLVLFPLKAFNWFIQALISIPVGMIAFPIELYIKIRRK